MCRRNSPQKLLFFIDDYTVRMHKFQIITSDLPKKWGYNLSIQGEIELLNGENPVEIRPVVLEQLLENRRAF